MEESEEWNDVPGYPGYQASTLGQVRSFRRGAPRILRRGKGKSDYPTVTLFSEEGRPHCMAVHRVVLLTYRGPRPPGHEARHFPDRNKQNCRLANLSWGTRAQNDADKVFHGTVPRGDNHIFRRHPERAARGDRSPSRLHPESRPRGDAHAARRLPAYRALLIKNISGHPKTGEHNGRATITEESAREILRMGASGMRARAIGNALGIPWHRARNVLRGVTWSHVTLDGASPHKRERTGSAKGARNAKAKITEDGVRTAFRLYGSGKSYKQIAEALGLTPVTVGKILRRQLWKHVELEVGVDRPCAG